MENTSINNDHANGYTHDIDLEDLKVFAPVLNKQTKRELPGASLADELIQSLLAENARLRRQVSSKPKMALGAVEQLGRENTSLRIENQGLKRELQKPGKTKYIAAELMKECYEVEAENHEETSDGKAELKLELLEAKRKIALLERQLSGAERIISDQASRLESTY